jgi:hypothetical protein
MLNNRRRADSQCRADGPERRLALTATLRLIAGPYDHSVSTIETTMNGNGFPWSLLLPGLMSDYWSHFTFVNAILLGVVLGIVTGKPPKGKS